MRVAALGAAVLALSVSVGVAEAPADEGEHLYTTICQGCHMAGGEGAVGAGTYPKLAGNPTVASAPYVAIMVLMGRKGMPPFGAKPGMTAQEARMLASLTDEEIAAIVNYVRSHFGNNFKDKLTPEDVARLPHPGEKGTGRAG